MEGEKYHELYFRFQESQKEAKRIDHNRIQFVIHGSILLSVLCISHLNQNSVNNVFFITSIIWAFLAYGGWYFQSWITQYLEMLAMQYFGIEKILKNNWEGENITREKNRDWGNIEITEENVRLIPHEYWPVKTLTSISKNFDQKMKNAGKIHTFLECLFYIGITLSLLFNIAGSVISFTTPLVISNCLAYPILFGSLLLVVIINTISFYITHKTSQG